MRNLGFGTAWWGDRVPLRKRGYILKSLMGLQAHDWARAELGRSSFAMQFLRICMRKSRGAGHRREWSCVAAG